MFQLFASPSSPYARKVRMVLAEKNVSMNSSTRAVVPGQPLAR